MGMTAFPLASGVTPAMVTPALAGDEFPLLGFTARTWTVTVPLPDVATA